MRTALVGYTGFVGSNLAESFKFDGLYNSQNIKEAYGKEPELLVYAGVYAEKFLANAQADQDFMRIRQAFQNIVEISPKKLVLISTIDVYDTPNGVDELTEIRESRLAAYGLNRYFLECQVRERYKDALIVRLPALFGRGLKKNFIYDYIHRVPTVLSASKMEELSCKISLLRDCYRLQKNGFFKLCELEREKERELRGQFEACGFTALMFTDSRSRYQFYHLRHLWKDICRALALNALVINISAEPAAASEVYEYLTGDTFDNPLSASYAKYDFRSIYAEQMGGKNGYIYSKNQVMHEIKTFVEEEMRFV